MRAGSALLLFRMPIPYFSVIARAVRFLVTRELTNASKIAPVGMAATPVRGFSVAWSLGDGFGVSAAVVVAGAFAVRVAGSFPAGDAKSTMA